MEVRDIEYECYLLSSDPLKIQPEAIHAFLSNDSYWAKGIPIEKVKTAIDHSICFGIYHNGKQVGFARWVTDYATFAYLADVYVLEAHRGKGLSKALMAMMMEEKEITNCRHLLLATLYSHGLYEKYGFARAIEPQRYMNIIKKDAYLNT